MGPGKIDPVIDFWVRRASGEEFQLVPHGTSDISLPSEVKEVPIRTINAVDRAASAVWTSNWMRMLPVINSARNAISKTTMKSVSRFVREPMPLAEIERQFGHGDPTVVRATIFEMLRIGQLTAPALRTEPLSVHTTLEPIGWASALWPATPMTAACKLSHAVHIWLAPPISRVFQPMSLPIRRRHCMPWT